MEQLFKNFWRTTQLEYTLLMKFNGKTQRFLGYYKPEDSLDKSMKTFNIDKSIKNELLSLYKILSPYLEVETG